MATIKSYSDLQQSKKLAEILPLESADMRYDEYTSHIDGTPKVGYKEGITEGIPCWSLAALLKLIPKYRCVAPTAPCDKYLVFNYIFESYGSCLVDAAYNMVVRLIENGYIKTETK